MRPASLWLAAIALLAGCSEPPQFDQARAAAAAKFAYSSGAETRAVQWSKDRAHVCGEIRGRDARGALSDWRRFAWSPREGAIVEGIDAGEAPALARTSAELQDNQLSTSCPPG
jgi:hypothetical protein